MLEKLKEKLSGEEFVELEKFIQSSEDKIRTKYSTEKKALEDELAKYKPKDKTDAEKALEAKMKELQDKEAELSKKEREYKLQETLTANNLPKDLAKYINGDDIDTIGKEIGAILNQHLLNNGFKPNNHKSTDTTITKDKFKKMNYSEREKLFNDNPELYKKLSE